MTGKKDERRPKEGRGGHRGLPQLPHTVADPIAEEDGNSQADRLDEQCEKERMNIITKTNLHHDSAV